MNIKKYIINVGDIFKELIVLEEPKNNKIPCRCSCGKIIITNSGSLRRGQTSCGCKKLTLGGLSNSPEYAIWNTMRHRCYNPKNKGYKDYGAKGITMSGSWKDNYVQFLEDMGTKPEKSSSIDRIENDKGYYKENCRWATKKEQANNRKSNRIITFKGETNNLTYFCEKYNLNIKTVGSRLSRGASSEEALKF